MITPDEPICIFSSETPEPLYRYTLWREVNPEASGITAFIGLNPSTATEEINDPTIRRCMRFARDFGSRYLCMLNVFGYRATDPKVMKRVEDPFGGENLYHITRVVKMADNVVAAWGTDGYWKDGGRIVQLAIQGLGPPDAPICRLKCLGKTRDGSPRHPLYIKATQPLSDYP